MFLYSSILIRNIPHYILGNKYMTFNWSFVRAFHNALHDFIRHIDTLDWSSKNPCGCEWRLDKHIPDGTSYFHLYISTQEPNDDYFLMRYLVQRQGDYIMSPNKAWLVFIHTSSSNSSHTAEVICLSSKEDIERAYALLNQELSKEN